MTPYYQDALVTLYQGDCREIIPALEDRFACVLTDPPYGLSFMGRDWDKHVPGQHFWETIRAACYPGAHLMAFGGTRTWHRLACAIEGAGWGIRDTIMWMHGMGFPKSLSLSKAIDAELGEEKIIGMMPDRWTGRGSSLNFSTDRPQLECKVTAPSSSEAKEWDGYGTALKPAWEHIILAMNPVEGTFAKNALKYGVGGLNIEAGRIATSDGYTENRVTQGINSGPPTFLPKRPQRRTFEPGSGRFPANLILDEESAAMLDEQTADLHSAGFAQGPQEKWQKESWDGVMNWGAGKPCGSRVGDTGGASRFFYTAKATPEERGESNRHPTVKPLALIHYLMDLLYPPKDGIGLDPFCGSGTTLVAAVQQGRQFVGIELLEENCETAVKRIQAAREKVGLLEMIA